MSLVKTFKKILKNVSMPRCFLIRNTMKRRLSEEAIDYHIDFLTKVSNFILSEAEKHLKDESEITKEALEAVLKKGIRIKI